MARTLREILDERAGALVGRERELSALLRLAGEDGLLVAYVHGIAGAGKSTLLRGFAARARAAGATVVQLDGAAIEPTERGFLAALGEARGEPAATPEDAARDLEAIGARVVLVVDTLERLRLLDDWLHGRLIPALPASARVVLAGRDAPDVGWTAAFGELLSVLALGSLEPGPAQELLRQGGVHERDVREVSRLAHGHPLSLRLAASALAARPELTLDQVALPAVVDGLADLYLTGLAPATRAALDAAAMVRRPTRPVLRAMLGEDAGDDAWERLDALPFTETGADGLVVHETVRAATDAALRAADPMRRRRLRAAAFAHLRETARDTPATQLWRSTSDLLFLIDNPSVRRLLPGRAGGVRRRPGARGRRPGDPGRLRAPRRATHRRDRRGLLARGAGVLPRRPRPGGRGRRLPAHVRAACRRGARH